MQTFLAPDSVSPAFLAASLVLAVTPGPGVLYIVTRSASQGRAAGLASVAGVALGNLGNATAASIGLAALFAVSALAFTLVKYLGAAYLIYLGVRTLRSARTPQTSDSAAVSGHRRLRRLFFDGFVVALFNPKTTLFFAAFLPQFLPPSVHPAQAVGLGAVFVVIAAVTDTCYALAAGSFSSVLAGSARKVGQRISGGTFIGLGLLTAVTGHQTSK